MSRFHGSEIFIAILSLFSNDSGFPSAVVLAPKGQTVILRAFFSAREKCVIKKIALQNKLFRNLAKKYAAWKLARAKLNQRQPQFLPSSF